MQKTVLLYFALLFWFVVPSQAQLTFSLPEITAENGERIEVDLEVENFSNVGSAQFTFSWDSSIINFVEIKDITFPNFNPDNSLNLTKVENGDLMIVWFTASSFELADGESLFTVVFDVIGNPGDSTSLALTDSPVPTIFGDPANNEFEVERPPGYVKIPGTSSTTSPSDFGWELKNPTPNPFQSTTQIEFYTPTATEVEWTIFDVAGKIILTNNVGYAPGHHIYFLEQQSLPVAGTYFVQMRTPEFVTTQKVDFIK